MHPSRGQRGSLYQCLLAATDEWCRSSPQSTCPHPTSLVGVFTRRTSSAYATTSDYEVRDCEVPWEHFFKFFFYMMNLVARYVDG